MTTPAAFRDLCGNVTDSGRGDDMGNSKDSWTRWINVDNPAQGRENGDFETVDRIQKSCRICNKGYDIVAAQCRWSGASEPYFDEDTPADSIPDVLDRFCTKEGLLCRNEDQRHGRMCHDYSIRFRCRYNSGNSNNDSFFPQFDVRIYIVLAVVPVLIFLARILWAYLCRRRRRQRRNQRRARQRLNGANSNGDNFDDDSSSIASGVANPPPSYQDLFGKKGHIGSGSSVFAISRDNIPICTKCESEQCSIALIIGLQRTLTSFEADGQDSVNVNGADRVSVVNEQRANSTEPGADVQNSATGGNNENPRITENSSQSPIERNEDTKVLAHSESEITHEETNASSTHSPVSEQEETEILAHSQDTAEEETRISIPSEVTPLEEMGVIINSQTTKQDNAENPANCQITTDEETGISSTFQTSTEETITVEIPPNIVDTVNSSFSQDNTLDASQIQGASIVNIENENLNQNYQENSTSDVAQGLPPTNTENTETLVSLNLSNLHSYKISQPCACPCHRTIPQKQLGVAGYDNHGYTADGGDAEGNRHPSFPGMHIPVFGHHRGWSVHSMSSVTQELPTYENALELMEKKTEDAKEKPN